MFPGVTGKEQRTQLSSRSPCLTLPLGEKSWEQGVYFRHFKVQYNMEMFSGVTKSCGDKEADASR
jgi:hypothetical protein